jgi:hypothetical protein
MSEKQLATFRLILPSKGEFHMGLCIGADIQAATIARELGYRIVGHPPTNQRKMGKFQCDEFRIPAEYLVRNRAIVLDTEVLVATPKEATESLRSGTWATVRYARTQKRNILIILPDGVLRAEAPLVRPKAF